MVRLVMVGGWGADDPRVDSTTTRGRSYAARTLPGRSMPSLAGCTAPPLVSIRTRSASLWIGSSRRRRWCATSARASDWRSGQEPPRRTGQATLPPWPTAAHAKGPIGNRSNAEPRNTVRSSSSTRSQGKLCVTASHRTDSVDRAQNTNRSPTRALIGSKNRSRIKKRGSRVAPWAAAMAS